MMAVDDRHGQDGLRFGFLMFPGFEELDFVGPWEMATMWSSYANGPECIAVAQHVEPLRCAKGLRVVPDHSFETCPNLDYLLVPGGFAALDQLNNEAMLDFVRKVAINGQYVLSSCTGALILEAAGLLAGRQATTHWKFLDVLRDCADVEVVEDRWVQSGSVWTSAGVSAGIDLTLAFIAHVAGDLAAGIVQFNSEYYPDPRLYGEAHDDPRAPGYLKALCAERAQGNPPCG